MTVEADTLIICAVLWAFIAVWFVVKWKRG
jgi:hypothetical protein